MFVVPGVACAAWDAVPQVGIGVTSNDNLFRSSMNEQSASRSVLDAGIRLTNFTERGEIFLNPRVTADSYADSKLKDFESTDSFLRAGGQYRWPAMTAGFRANYFDRSVLRAEFADAAPEDPDVEDPANGGTGRIESAQAKRKQAAFGGNLDFRLSPDNELRLDLLRTDSSYSREAVATLRSDYDDTSLTMELDHQLSARNRLSATLLTSQFNAKDNDNTTDSVGVQVSFTRVLSELWTFNLFAGTQSSDYVFTDLDTQTQIENSASNALFGIGFRKRTERSTWNLDLRHGTDASANGFLNERNYARIFLRQQFTPRFTGAFAVLLSSYTPIDNLDRTEERDYARLQLNFEWAMSRTWLLTFGIDTLRQEFVNEDSRTIDANTAFVGIQYRGLSRQNQ